MTKCESGLELAQQRLISPDLNHSEVPNKTKGAENSHPKDTSPGNRNPAPPVVVTGGNGCPGALQLHEGTKRISQGWDKSGIFSARVSSRARVTELKLPPTHPLLTPWPRMKPSPGTQPWKSTKLGEESRTEAGEEEGKARNSSTLQHSQ